MADRKIRILVAEDDPTFAKMLDDSLQESGSPYHLEKVSSGQECLKRLQQKKFDLLLLDYKLPDGPGLDWLRRFNVLGVGGGEFTFLFWVVFAGIGVILPLSLEVYELIPHFIKQVALREHTPWISMAVTASVLLGGFLLRYVGVYAGQIPQVISA